MQVEEMARRAKAAALELGALDTNKKNSILLAMADGLMEHMDAILAANAQDMENARANGRPEAMIDRLALNEKRIAGMAGGIRQVAALADPVGEMVSGGRRPNGLEIVKKRVPMGVVGIIYEARPNVTADAMALCLKSGNAAILKGGSEAIRSNQAVAEALVTAAEESGAPQGALWLVEDTSREEAQRMMRLNGLIDVLIPRGGAGLIRSVVENATVPVIETGVGNCHVFVDASADLDMAVTIAVNAKVSRPAVCNAAESLLVHADVAEALFARLLPAMAEQGVELRGCPRSQALGVAIPATEEDFATEYLDLILSVKIVDSVSEAIGHVNRYGTGHSEAIITRNLENARLFQTMVDAAAVYVNASTRFTDGEEFGFGAEIGISTQKLHARGPMGLKELTTFKYLITGDGQIR